MHTRISSLFRLQSTALLQLTITILSAILYLLIHVKYLYRSAKEIRKCLFLVEFDDKQYNMGKSGLQN